MNLFLHQTNFITADRPTLCGAAGGWSRRIWIDTKEGRHEFVVFGPTEASLYVNHTEHPMGNPYKCEHA